MATQTLAWWALLSSVAVVNVLFWAFSVHRLRPRWASVAEDRFDRDFRRLQLLLSAGYVAGCAWRSLMPVFDVPRLVLVDSWLSSVIVGRSVATIAELCFAAQWALVLRAAADTAGSRGVRFLSGLLVPLIVAAEVCSWHAVLTTSNLGHVIEESLWGLCAVLVVLGLLWTSPQLHGRLRAVALTCSAAGAAYAAYMFFVDVPMYWSRWLADEAQGRVYLDLAQGLADASSRWTVSHDWAHWRSEVVWMSAYFSVAVWVSIGLAHTPVWARAVRSEVQHA
ncbi:MAG: hypothetical protein WAQ05_26920 [Rubrivivax sp.]